MCPITATVDLYWLPLGAGGRFVRLNGRIYEALTARLHRRPRRDLYHSALEVRLGHERYVIEMAPVWNERVSDRGVVVEGPVGSRLAGHLRLFRYELRRWRDGRIPDAAEAVESPRELSTDPVVAQAVLELVPQVPALVWGRDELGLGDMWNSNSAISWLLARAGLDVGRVQPPAGGRAPGWEAGRGSALERMAETAPGGNSAVDHVDDVLRAGALDEAGRDSGALA